MSPTMILKGVRGTNNEAFQERVDRLYGGREWRQIQRAFDQRKIVAREYRQQMVNLIRWKLEHDLGYEITQRIPMQMHNKMEIYDMVFATDHVVVDRIMQHLYNQAALREPDMMRQAKEAKTGQFSLFDDYGVEDASAGQRLWHPEPCWDPTTQSGGTRKTTSTRTARRQLAFRPSADHRVRVLRPLACDPPLLEEECDAGILALVADPADPFTVDGTVVRARSAAGNNPVDSLKVEPVERSYQGLTRQESNGRGNVA